MEISIDRNLCTQCGTCVEVCPAGVMSQAAPKSQPVVDEALAEDCLRCGHCTAVCPGGALSLEGVRPEALPLAAPPTEALRLAVEQAILSRRSIREYSDRPLSQETIARLIESARFAPTGSNSQGVEWLVVNGKEKVRRIAELSVDGFRALLARPSSESDRLRAFAEWGVEEWDRGEDALCRGASALVVAHAHEQALSGPIDCVLALGYLDLLASAAGLGTCWAGAVHIATQISPPLVAHLSLPSSHRIHGMMMLGYPKYRYRRVPQRNRAAVTWRL
jgi:nitroreductase/NAD-dependent dihydropyrimidine dehydrogenase PreA subunit